MDLFRGSAHTIGASARSLRTEIEILAINLLLLEAEEYFQLDVKYPKQALVLNQVVFFAILWRYIHLEATLSGSSR